MKAWLRHRLPSPGAILIGLLATGTTFAADAGPAATPQPQPAMSTTVRDLRYGTTLFHFYQQQYFDALTELMAGQQLQALPNHAASAELLRGGISLSFGLQDEAQRIFEQWLAHYGNSGQQDTAWFYLGKLAWQRDQRAASGAALGRLRSANETGLAPELADEAAYLRASLALRNGDDQGAELAMATVPEASTWQAYYAFNRAVLAQQAGDTTTALEFFGRLQKLAPPDTETPAGESAAGEMQRLQDRGLIAAGFTHLAASNPEQAMSEFVRVRQSSEWVDRALLGYGWAAAQAGDYQRALQPWQALQSHSLFNATAQESLLAVPFAYEKLAAPASALQAYEHSVHLLQSEQQRLREGMARLASSPTRTFLEMDRYDSDEWLGGGDILPVNQDLPYLAQLITRHHFQLALRDLRDLYKLELRLRDGLRRIEVLQGVLDDRQRVWEQQTQTAQRDVLQQRHIALQQQRDRLQAEIKAALAAPDGRALAEGEQRSLWQRLERAETKLKAVQAAAPERQAEWALAADKLRRYRGLLAYETAQQSSVNAWALQRDSSELDSLLQQTQQLAASVDSALRRPPAPDRRARLASLSEQYQRESAQVAAAIAASERAVRDVMQAELSAHEQRLGLYLGQARLAIARLYDFGTHAPAAARSVPAEVAP